MSILRLLNILLIMIKGLLLLVNEVVFCKCMVFKVVGLLVFFCMVSLGICLWIVFSGLVIWFLFMFNFVIFFIELEIFFLFLVVYFIVISELMGKIGLFCVCKIEGVNIRSRVKVNVGI